MASTKMDVVEEYVAFDTRERASGINARIRTTSWLEARVAGSKALGVPLKFVNAARVFVEAKVSPDKKRG